MQKNGADIVFRVQDRMAAGLKCVFECLSFMSALKILPPVMGRGEVGRVWGAQSTLGGGYCEGGSG